MDVNNKAAFDECDLLEENIDMDKVPYDILQNTSAAFLKGITKTLFKDELIQTDYYEFAMKALNYANDFYEKGIGDAETLYKYRLNMWSIYKQYNKQKKRIERKLARVIVCCFYDEEDPSAQDERHFLYLDLLSDINPVYCKQYREFCEVALKDFAFEK